jgi:hypothetical protein
MKKINKKKKIKEEKNKIKNILKENKIMGKKLDAGVLGATLLNGLAPWVCHHIKIIRKYQKILI